MQIYASGALGVLCVPSVPAAVLARLPQLLDLLELRLHLLDLSVQVPTLELPLQRLG